MTRYQKVYSKMEKGEVMLANPRLAPHLPETVGYSLKNLEKMILKYGRVFVKPDRGRKGNKVVCITKEDRAFYRYHYRFDLSPPVDLESVNTFIKNLAGGKKFIIQKGIDVLRAGDAPVDFRIVIQKPYDTWIVTGITGKIAAPGCAVTNYSHGGTLHDYDEVLRKTGLTAKEIKEAGALLTFLGKETAETLNRQYPGLRELGVDAGLDQKRKPWIFEVNTQPQFPRGNDTIRRFHKIILERYG